MLAPLVPLVGCGDAPPSPASTTGLVDTGSSTQASVGETTLADATGSSSTGEQPWATSTGAALPGEEELALQAALRVCALIEACNCPNNDPLKCVAQVEARIAEWQGQAVDAGLVFDPQCWARVVGELDSLECGAPALFECAVYHGELARGEACDRMGPWMNDCAPPLLCPYDGAPCLAVGAEPEVLGEGEACFDADAGTLLGLCDSRQALECDFETGVCVVEAAKGLPCEDGECASGAWCDDLDDDGPVCKPQRPSGAPCTVAEACQSSLCVEGTCAEFPDRACFFLPPWEP